jgi:hypothetical protein
MRWLLGVVVLTVVGAGVVVVWPRSDGNGNDADRAPRPTRSITPFLERPGDQVVTVPAGRYSGGAVTAHHGATDGPLAGWLVLVAEPRGSVVVDLSRRDLRLRDGTSRIAFVGFAFENGRIRNHGTHIRYWYTTHTFPYRYWVKAGGPDGPHSRPKAMLIGDASNVEIYGADFVDIGDDAINIFNARDLLIEGSVFQRIANRGHGDVIHADAIQVQGDVRRMTVRQSVLERQHIGTESKGDVARLTWEDCWFRDSRSAGITFVARDGLRISGTRTDIRSFRHANGHDRIDVVDGDRRKPNSARRRIDVDDDGVVTGPPRAGIPSPAEVWRATHPYETWETLFLRQ